MKFTDAKVRNLKPRASRYEVREDSGHGQGNLVLRVTPSGHKSFVFRFTLHGLDKRMTLGRYPAMSVAEAHAAASQARLDVEHGIDPAAKTVAVRVAERQAPTFAELAELFMAQHARVKKRPASVAGDAAKLKRDLLPAFGPHKAEAIERADVRTLLQGIVTRGAPIQANRTLALLRKIYNWGIGEDLVTRNPCDRLPAPAKERQRDRVLNEVELRALMVALPTSRVSRPVQLILQLQLLTAQRCGEVLRARWDQIDLTGTWWTIPAEMAKNGLSHRVPLSPQAVAVLEEARQLSPSSATVFPSPRADKPMVITTVGLAVRRNAGDFAAVGGFKPHDLRRTAASHLTGMGFPRLVVSKLLNHAEGGVTAIYDRHSYDQEKREALVAWGERVDAMGTPACLSRLAEDVKRGLACRGDPSGLK